MGPCKHQQLKGDDINSIKNEILLRENQDLKKSEQFKLAFPCGSQRGGNCFTNAINCIFDIGEITSVKTSNFCEGD